MFVPHREGCAYPCESADSKGTCMAYLTGRGTRRHILYGISTVCIYNRLATAWESGLLPGAGGLIKVEKGAASKD